MASGLGILLSFFFTVTALASNDNTDLLGKASSGSSLFVSAPISSPGINEDSNDPFEYSFHDDFSSNYGWEEISGTGLYRYRFLDGGYVIGWLKIGPDWYYFNSYGIRLSGLLTLGGKRYYLDQDGKLQTGWKAIKGKSYYFLPDQDEETVQNLTTFPSWDIHQLNLQPSYGYAVTGWQTINGKRYCFSENGTVDRKYEFRNLLAAIDFASDESTKIDEAAEEAAKSEAPAADPAEKEAAEEAAKTEEASEDAARKDKDTAESGKTPAESNNTAPTTKKSLYCTSDVLSEKMTLQLKKDIDFIEDETTDVGFLLVDINSSEVLCYNTDQYFYSASTLKAPYVVSLALDEGDKLENYTEQIRKTISLSDNDTYMELYMTFGSEHMLSFMAGLGIQDTFSGYSMYTDIRSRDLAKLWVGMYEAFRADNGKIEWLLPFFRHSQMSFIDNVLGWDQEVYSKAGWDCSYYGFGTDYKIYNDAGIVMKEDSPYLLVIMSTTLILDDNPKLYRLVRDLDRAHTELAQGNLQEEELIDIPLK